MTNLEISIGKFSPEIPLETIARKAFSHLGCVLVEFLTLPYWTLKDMETLVECKNLEHFRMHSKKNKGAILLTAHLGNWEMLGAFFTKNHFSLNAINRKQKGLFADIISQIREECGMKLVFKGAGIREAIRCLKRGEILGILSDQGGGVRVPFLFRDTDMPTGAATLAVKLNVPVIPGFLMRKKLGFVFETGAPVNLVKTDNPQADLIENTRRISHEITKIIMKYPDQWFWLHKMWKEEY